jgi:hypothetical protein
MTILLYNITNHFLDRHQISMHSGAVVAIIVVQLGFRCNDIIINDNFTLQHYKPLLGQTSNLHAFRGRHGRDRSLVGFWS